MLSCKEESEYGQQRLWGSVAWGAMAPLAGWLVSQHGIGLGFALYASLAVLQVSLR